MEPTLIKGFLSSDTCSLITHLAFLEDDDEHYYFKEEADQAEYRSNSTRGPTWEKYGPNWGEALLLSKAHELMGVAGGVNLLPTYSFARFYWADSFLIPHCDRAECENTATICITHKLNSPNLFWVLHEGERFEFYLDPGDAVLYRGNRDKHARDKLDGWYLGMMLHYVNNNGKHRELGYDRRIGTRRAYERVLQSLGGDA